MFARDGALIVQVKEIADSVKRDEQEVLRWQAEALLALQEAAEAYLVHLFEDAYVDWLFLRQSHCAICLCTRTPIDSCSFLSLVVWLSHALTAEIFALSMPSA